MSKRAQAFSSVYLVAAEKNEAVLRQSAISNAIFIRKDLPMKKRPFTSSKGNIPKFPYSQAVIYGDLIFISAQPPVDPETGDVESGDVKVQTRRILANVSGILEDAGTSLDNLLKVTVFLKDRSLFSDFNDAYAGFFPENPPARSPVFTDTGDYLVTMDFIAGMD